MGMPKFIEVTLYEWRRSYVLLFEVFARDGEEKLLVSREILGAVDGWALAEKVFDIGVEVAEDS